MKKWRMPLVAGFFIALAIFDTALAWGGDHFALLGLASLAIITSFFTGLYGKMTRDVLDGWNRSNKGWHDTQDLLVRKDAILREALIDLVDHDPEAASIHTGRSLHANTEFIKTMGEDQ